jgi:hypothetical protein
MPGVIVAPQYAEHVGDDVQGIEGAFLLLRFDAESQSLGGMECTEA